MLTHFEQLFLKSAHIAWTINLWPFSKLQFQGRTSFLPPTLLLVSLLE